MSTALGVADPMDNANKRGAVSTAMEAIRLAARLEHHTLDELEAGFADHVSSRAVFLSRRVLGASIEDPAVGSAVNVEVELASGDVGLAVFGIVAWTIPAGRAPPGREAGIGVAILGADDDNRARLDRMGRAPGAGARVRVPGLRLTQRLNLGEPLNVVVIPRPPLLSAEPADSPATVPFGAGVHLAPFSVDAEADAFLQANTVELPAPPRPRLMGLLADRALGDSEADGAVADSRVTAKADVDSDEDAPATDDSVDESDAVADALERRLAAANRAPLPAPAPNNFLEAPTLDGVDDGTPTATRSASLSSSASSSSLASLASSLPMAEPPSLDPPSSELATEPPPGLESLPDAPALDSPFSPEAARPFESQSTDIDLLASISADDIVSLEYAAGVPEFGGAPPGSDDVATPFNQVPSTRPHEPFKDLGDLPSADADLVAEDDAADWEMRTDHASASPSKEWPSLDLGETVVLDVRPLPAPDAWPAWSDLLDARTIGMSCSYSRRGQLHVEHFSWPRDSTKRYSKGEVEVAPADADVFSSSNDENLFGPSLELGAHEPDPFAAAGTDPRLNVEGVVAKNVRAAHVDESDADVFSTSDLDGDADGDLAGLDVVRRPAHGELDGLGDLDDDLGDDLDGEATHDGMPMPMPRPSSQEAGIFVRPSLPPALPEQPPQPPQLDDDESDDGHDGDDSDDVSTDRELRRPPPKTDPR